MHTLKKKVQILIKRSKQKTFTCECFPWTGKHQAFVRNHSLWRLKIHFQNSQVPGFRTRTHYRADCRMIQSSRRTIPALLQVVHAVTRRYLRLDCQKTKHTAHLLWAIWIFRIRWQVGHMVRLFHRNRSGSYVRRNLSHGSKWIRVRSELLLRRSAPGHKE